MSTCTYVLPIQATARTGEDFKVVKFHNVSYKLDKGVCRREMSQWRRSLPPVLDGQGLTWNVEFHARYAVRNMPPYKCGVFVRCTAGNPNSLRQLGFS